MAAPYSQFRPPPNRFDVYPDAASGRSRSGNLPSGGCNFVDLTPGANGAKCGCRKFWGRQASGTSNPAAGPQQQQQGWCMCNHHACYHNDTADDHVSPTQAPIGRGQENERPKHGPREPLSPMVEVQQSIPPSIPGLGFPSFSGGGAPLSFINDRPDMSLPNTPPTHNVAPSLPDTINWGDVAQSRMDTSGLPPIPAQCLMPSQTASTTSSVQAKYHRPFSGKGLDTLSRSTSRQPSTFNKRQPERPYQDHQPSAMAIDQESGTPRTTIATQVEPRTAEKPREPREALKNLADTVGAHEQRLDRLETTSFGGGHSHEECNEKHEHFDLRITEIEGKMDELEKQYNDDAATSRRGDRNDDATTQSGLSVVSDATSRPLHSHELLSKIQSLEEQVSQLKSFLPSFNNPWEVEVVFLPFPLKRIWQDIHQFKAEPTISNDDWTQLPATMSSFSMRSQSPMVGDWANPSHAAEWLMPKACSDKSVTDKRLRSRGLIKKVSVRGADARSVQTAIEAAFGSVFQEMLNLPRHHEADPRLAKYPGLQSSWIPLRKIHKDSRLRFLSPSEMVTPALWDVPFLNSVMMRSSEPRLFVTHPNAYLQDMYAFEGGWTWQRVRELTRVYPDVGDGQGVPEADAMEEHWAWNSQMDEHPSATASMSLHNAQRVSQSPADLVARVNRWRSQSPAVAREFAAATSSHRRSMPPHSRPTSLPPVPPGPSRPPTLERRMTTAEYHRRSSSGARVAPSGGIMKPRFARSPSFGQVTPRQTVSPSPMPWGVHHDRQPPRGITPAAYATPYSNAPPTDPRLNRSGSVVRFETHHQYYEDSRHAIDDEDEVYIKQQDSDSDNNNINMANLPEADPWTGMDDGMDDDEDHALSDSENVDPEQARRSQQEYARPAFWPGNEFSIHEDPS